MTILFPHWFGTALVVGVVALVLLIVGWLALRWLLTSSQGGPES